MSAKRFNFENPQVEPSGRGRGKAKALLVACAVGSLSTAAGCWPVVYGNPKGCRFDADAGQEVCDWDEFQDVGSDAGVDPDAGEPVDGGGEPDDGGIEADGGVDGGS